MKIFNQILSEFLGTMALLIIVVGSGIMGEQLAGGNMAMVLLANSLATGMGLYALIQTFGHISGANFNPLVSFIDFLRKKISGKIFLAYVLAQVVGGAVGVFLTHVMFGQRVFQFSVHHRSDFRFLVSEVVATAGLLLVIALSGKKRPEATPSAVACYIAAAYWCTSSTSFANPAVTIARSLSNTFSGISPSSVLPFMLAQVLGAVIAFGLILRFSLQRV